MMITKIEKTYQIESALCAAFMYCDRAIAVLSIDNYNYCNFILNDIASKKCITVIEDDEVKGTKFCDVDDLKSCIKELIESTDIEYTLNNMYSINREFSLSINSDEYPLVNNCDISNLTKTDCAYTLEGKYKIYNDYVKLFGNRYTINRNGQLNEYLDAFFDNDYCDKLIIEFKQLYHDNITGIPAPIEVDVIVDKYAISNGYPIYSMHIVRPDLAKELQMFNSQYSSVTPVTTEKDFKKVKDSFNMILHHAKHIMDIVSSTHSDREIIVKANFDILYEGE